MGPCSRVGDLPLRSCGHACTVTELQVQMIVDVMESDETKALKMVKDTGLHISMTPGLNWVITRGDDNPY